MKIYDVTTHTLFAQGNRVELAKKIGLTPDTLSRARREKRVLKNKYMVLHDEDIYEAPPSYTEMVINVLKVYGNSVCAKEETIEEIKSLGYDISSRFIPKMKGAKWDKGFWVICLN